MSPHFDNEHFEYVKEKVSQWYQKDEEEKFLVEPFTYAEVEKGIVTLHKGKAPGHDLITRENIDAAGPILKEVLYV